MLWIVVKRSRRPRRIELKVFAASVGAPLAGQQLGGVGVKATVFLERPVDDAKYPARLEGAASACVCFHLDWRETKEHLTGGEPAPRHAPSTTGRFPNKPVARKRGRSRPIGWKAPNDSEGTCRPLRPPSSARNPQLGLESAKTAARAAHRPHPSGKPRSPSPIEPISSDQARIFPRLHPWYL
jgi:hypothetical protein